MDSSHKQAFEGTKTITQFDVDDPDFCWKYHIEETFHDESELKTYKGLFYHYTSRSGFVGILESQRVWATEFSFLNDSNELKYGVNIANTILQDMIRSHINKTEKLFLEQVLISLQKDDFWSEFYVASFSEHGDQLGQWKGYAENGAGFSMGFDLKQLTRWNRKDVLDINFFIKPVIYDEEAQAAQLAAIINKVLENILSLSVVGCSDSDFISIARCLANFIKTKSIFFKSSVFAEEKEWRVVYRNGGSSEVERFKTMFRERNSKIIPYIELDLAPNKSNVLLSVKEIIIGSKNKIEDVSKLVQYIYKNNNTSLNNTLKFVESKIPSQ